MEHVDKTKTPTTFDTPPWLKRSRFKLLKDVTVGKKQNKEKLERIAHTLSCYINNPVVERRLERLKDLGHMDVIPSGPQMIIASSHQILLALEEETKVFYEKQNIPWVFHNVRRFIADPSTYMDPVGLYSHRDTLISHILQTYHRHPLYDLVLLRAHKDGIEEMEAQLEQLLHGKHLHQRALNTLAEEPSYHERLWHQLQDFKKDPHVAPNPIPAGLNDDPNIMLAMDQFKDLRGFTNYAAKLNVGRASVVKGVFEQLHNYTFGKITKVQLGPKQIRIDCCDADIVRRYYSV